MEEALEATEKKLAKANAALKELKVCLCVFFPVPPSTIAAR